MKRRNLLGLSLGGIAAVIAAVIGMRRTPERPQRRDANRSATLQAYVDTLVPADEDFPGAIAIGVVSRLLAELPKASDYRTLVDQGLAWLDAQAQAQGAAEFGSLASEARERIVRLAEASPAGSMPRVFFQATRDDVMFHTYTDARSWDGIGYDGPPQPRGFLDYAQPPRASRATTATS